MYPVPLSYKLTIKTSLPESFSGVAEISLRLATSTNLVTINTAEPLRLLGCVFIQGVKRIPVVRTEYDAANELTSLSFAEKIEAGEAVLGLRWEGRLAGNMLGFYRIPASQHTAENSSFYAVTQFEPTSARKAFPCFDHPAKKAPFTISLISPKGLTSLSNSAEKSRTPSNGSFPPSDVLSAAFLAGTEGELADAGEPENKAEHWELVEFEPTPKMSTYLAAWAVGDFDCISSSFTSPLTGREVPLQVYASRMAGHLERGQGLLALDTLEGVMPIYEKLFGIPYELPKLDLIICDEFDAGAMENWGLITGSVRTMLYDPKLSGVAAKHTVVSTVSHECAHMWFGDLVSPAWWDDLWLNESFATLIGEVVAIERLHPAWRPHSTFLKAHRTSALQLDALRSSHPVQMCCKHDSDVTQAFDHISYEKGSAVLKMLMSLIGEEKFLEGTSRYLTKHAHSSATSADLWTSFSAVCDFDVADLMDSWIEQVGFPVLTVVDDGDKLILRQSKFTSERLYDSDRSLWTIPLFIKAVGSEGAVSPVLMRTREFTLSKPDELYLLNAGTEGLYRVAYPSSYLDKLAEEACRSDSRLTTEDRVGIVQDVVALSEAGYSSTVSALSFLRRIAAVDSEYLVWCEIAGAFKRLGDACWEQPEDDNRAIKALGREVFAPMVQELGFESKDGEGPDERKFRALVLTAAAIAEEPSVLAWVRQSFAGLLAGQVSPTAADLSPLIVWATAHHGGEQEYEIARKIFDNPPTPQHQVAAVAGLTGTRDVALLRRTMGITVSGEVQPDRLPQFLHGLASNTVSRRLVWGFFQQAWPKLEQQFKGSMLLGKIAAVAFESFSSELDADAVEAFFADKDTVAFEQPLQQGLDTVRSKARWLAREAQPVQAWLTKEGFLAVAEDTEKARDSGFAQ